MTSKTHVANVCWQIKRYRIEWETTFPLSDDQLLTMHATPACGIDVYYVIQTVNYMNCKFCINTACKTLVIAAFDWEMVTNGCNRNDS